MLLDRRRLRRKLGLWRGLAIVAAVLGLGALALVGSGARDLVTKDQIARVTIEGLITDDRKKRKLLQSLAKADHVKGVLVYVNSPGGTTTGGEMLYNQLREISKKKPVVAQFGTIAASAGYIVGLGTDHIVSRGNTITGSIGVIMQWPEFTGLLDKVGVKMNTVKSGSLKAEPSPFEPLNEESKQLLQSMIADGQKWFTGLVETRRKIDLEAVPGLLKGRVYSGRDALKHKLIDAIGGEDEVRKYLTEKRKLPKDLKIVDWKPKRDLDWPFSSATANFIVHTVAAWLGSTTLGPTSTSLEGMVSVWRPGQ